MATATLPRPRTKTKTRCQPRRSAKSIFPTIGNLIDDAEKLRVEIVRREKAINAEEKYLTADKWRYGQILVAIKDQCKRKGDWKKALDVIGDTYQRADENIKIGLLFPSAEEAGKCPVRQAIKLICNGGKGSEDDADADVDAESVQSDVDVPTRGITARAMAGGDYRQENDDYYTPLEAITSFLDVEKFEGLTWEPAEGDKRIVQALKQIGCKVIGSDLATGTDFLQTKRKVDNVVTNPPWSKKDEFIRHAKECSRKKVAMLLPLSALSGVGRRPLFEDADFPLRIVYVFERRLKYDGPDVQSNRNSLITAGWFVWERGHQGRPIVEWIG